MHLPVGEVDVRHGPLRARNGGSVSADDVVAEVVRALPERHRAALGGVDSATDAYGEAVLALLLLATPRARRIQLDDAVLRRELATLACLVDAAGDGAAVALEAEVDEADAAETRKPGAEDVRDALAELDLAASNAARAATALEPALATRSLRAAADSCDRLALAGDGAAASALASAGDGMRALMREAIPQLAGLPGIALPALAGAGAPADARVGA